MAVTNAYHCGNCYTPSFGIHFYKKYTRTCIFVGQDIYDVAINEAPSNDLSHDMLKHWKELC